jgi:hypothetical protein
MEGTRYREFTPENKAFTLQIPFSWELEMDEGTFVWFDEDDWKGNFRLTPFVWGRPEEQDGPKAFLDEEFSGHAGAQRKRYGTFDAVNYIVRTDDDHEPITVFYFSLASGKYIFLFSFTVYTQDEQGEVTRAELEKIEVILHSLELNT